MRLGILSDRHLGENVPGTALLDDLHSTTPAHVDVSAAKLKRSKDGIILIPQPSDSPNDPLNWPFWRKCALMVTITYGAGVVGAIGPILTAGLVQVAEDLGTTNDGLSKTTGDLVLSIGLVLLLTAPASVLWGRRPVFLLGNALLLAGAIWSACARDLGSLTGGRVITGMGMAPLECLVEATISDVFFVHERGTWIAIWSFAILGGICGVSIINGYLIQDVTWRACFIIEAALIAILFVLTVLFVPETAYVRKEISTMTESEGAQGIDTRQKPSSESEQDASSVSSSKKAQNINVQVENRVGDGDQEKTLAGQEDGGRRLDDSPAEADERRQSFRQSLKPWAGQRFSDESFWRVAMRPFTLALSPVVAWGTLVYGTTNAWLVALSVCVSLLFSAPQFGYSFQPGPIGLISGVGPLIFSFLGNAIAGPMSDWIVKWMSRRNGGVYEPEFRLLMVVPLFVSTTMAWFGWAISASLEELWVGPAIFYSLINFGQAVGTIAVVSYVIDAHSNYAPETFAAVNALKNTFAFGVTYFVTPWILNQGVLRTFCTIGGINIAVCLTAIPMYMYGKRARSWVHRTPWMLA